MRVTSYRGILPIALPCYVTLECIRKIAISLLYKLFFSAECSFIPRSIKSAVDNRRCSNAPTRRRLIVNRRLPDRAYDFAICRSGISIATIVSCNVTYQYRDLHELLGRVKRYRRCIKFPLWIDPESSCKTCPTNRNINSRIMRRAQFRV